MSLRLDFNVTMQRMVKYISSLICETVLLCLVDNDSNEVNIAEFSRTP